MKYPTKEEIEKHVIYDPTTGVFTRTKIDRRGSKEGIAGGINSNGYIKISINNIGYYAHRLAWIVTYGYNPDMKLDHINRIRTDNRIVNLREVTDKENALNKSLRVDNKSGLIGVYWHKASNKWMVEVGRKYLGLYDSLLEAAVCSITYGKQIKSI